MASGKQMSQRRSRRSAARQSLNRYLAEIKKFPMLTPEQEYMLAKRYQEHDDPEAAAQLVTSHLRLVAKIAMGYRGYGLPRQRADLRRQYRPDAGREEVRARSRLPPRHLCDVVDPASIQEFILRSWSLVKMGTTAAQKKLFFNLRRMKKKLDAFEDGDLQPEDVHQDRDRSRRDRGGSDQHEPPHGDGRRYVAQRARCARMARASGRIGWPTTARCRTSSSPRPRKRRCATSMLIEAMDSLNEREKHILTERRLTDDPKTLEELSPGL